MFAPGELLAGKYRVERELGAGGMGIVLAARHEQLNTSVAIKLLRAEALNHTDIVGRFMREARAAVSLKSEHVARVYDVGNLEDGRPFIVMERLEGRDLGDVVDQGPPVSVPEAVDWVMQACEAIAEAHSLGIVHRDLKPKNLFLTRAVHGRPLVKVLDFGISKIDPNMSPHEMQLTKTAEIIGSPSYMSPEQLRASRNVDTRTDIWALGAILYELLTGRVPFVADTVTALVLVVVTEREPAIRSLRPEVPEGLEAVVARCLQKDPAHRFQSVVELVQALEPYAQGEHASMADRVRAVAARSGPQLPASPMSVSSSSRINVHGGTSVAWGETESMAEAATAPQRRSNKGLVVGLGAAAFMVLAGGIGGGIYFVKRTNAQPPVVVAVPAASESAMPLPPSRKDLPPEPAPPAPSPEPPAASTLPEVRKPPPPKPTAAPKPTSAPKGHDDLSNIGRR
jgi:serine/threonine-protein kinase